MPPQGAPGGSGQLGTPRKRPARWAPRHGLGCSRSSPPKLPTSAACTIQAELLALRQGSAALRDELQAARSEGAAAALKAEQEAEARALAAKGAAEGAVARHLEFIDRLLVDKQELSKRCEGAHTLTLSLSLTLCVPQPSPKPAPNPKSTPRPKQV